MSLRNSAFRQLVLFFVLAFAIGWAAWLPYLLNHANPKPGAFLYLYSPALAGLITAALVNGAAGVRDVVGRYLDWKFPLCWYLLAVALLPAIFLAAALLQQSQQRESLWTGSPWYFVLASFVFLLVITSGEEIGWRGFALPRLQGLVRSPLLAAILLGAIWGLWHLPLYADPAQSGFPLPLFLLFLLGLSLIYSVLFNRTRGSLLLAVLLHASTDIAPRFINIANFTAAGWFVIVVLTWLSALLLYYLTRGAAPVTAG